MPLSGVEACSTRKNDTLTTTSFFFEEIMMRFGHPLELVSDQGKHFLNDLIVDITSRYLIKHQKTTPYNPKANRLTERAYGIVGKILSKMVPTHKMDWDFRLLLDVHAYNTSEKKKLGKSPFFLVFEQIVVHGVEIGIESHWILATRVGAQVENPETRLIAIDDLAEARKDALERTSEIQAKQKKNLIASFQETMESKWVEWSYYTIIATRSF